MQRPAAPRPRRHLQPLGAKLPGTKLPARTGNTLPPKPAPVASSDDSALTLPASEPPAPAVVTVGRSLAPAADERPSYDAPPPPSERTDVVELPDSEPAPLSAPLSAPLQAAPPDSQRTAVVEMPRSEPEPATVAAAPVASEPATEARPLVDSEPPLAHCDAAGAAADADATVQIAPSTEEPVTQAAPVDEEPPTEARPTLETEPPTEARPTMASEQPMASEPPPPSDEEQVDFRRTMVSEQPPGSYPPSDEAYAAPQPSPSDEAYAAPQPPPSDEAYFASQPPPSGDSCAVSQPSATGDVASRPPSSPQIARCPLPSAELVAPRPMPTADLPPGAFPELAAWQHARAEELASEQPMAEPVVAAPHHPVGQQHLVPHRQMTYGELREQMSRRAESASHGGGEPPKRGQLFTTPLPPEDETPGRYSVAPMVVSEQELLMQPPRGRMHTALVAVAAAIVTAALFMLATNRQQVAWATAALPSTFVVQVCNHGTQPAPKPAAAADAKVAQPAEASEAEADDDPGADGNKGTVEARVKGGSCIFLIDGQVQKQGSEMSSTVLVGRHVVGCVRRGQRPATKQVEVESGQTVKVQF